MKLFIFDLDWTLRKPKSGKIFASDPDDQEPLEGSQKALVYYASRDFKCVGVSNQGGVAAGHKSLENAIEEQKITLQLFPELESILICPDYKGEKCWRTYQNGIVADVSEKYPDLIGTYRKPFAGMVNVLLISNEIEDKSDCWMAGDRTEDMACAIAAGIRFVWADMLLSKFVPGMHEPKTEGIDRETILDFLVL